MKYPFLRHITKIRNPRGKVKHSIIYFQQFTHFFILKTRQKNGRSVYLVQTVRSPLTDHAFTPFAPSVHPSQTMCLPRLHRPFRPSQTVHLPRLYRPPPPRRPCAYPVCTARSPPHRPRIHPACITRFSQPHYPYSPYPFISNNELLYISNEYIIYILTSHSASAIP